MLILRRRVGESILIGDSIEVEISEIGPFKVKLAVRAPGNVVVLRKELVQAREQNRLAASISPEARLNVAQTLSQFFPQMKTTASDKSFEARYSGHPEKENLEPA